MKKVVHLIPYDGIGGVEVAANTMRGLNLQDLEFSVQSVYLHVPGYKDRLVTFGVSPLLRAFFRTRAQGPDLLIVSLWRAAIIGILMKLIQPKIRMVLMLHNTKNAHWLDWLITAAASRLADEIWGDSTQSVEERLSNRTGGRRRVISFVTRQFTPLLDRPLRPVFIFWGRLNRIKGVDRALDIFARIAERRGDARFVIVGPDGGALTTLYARIEELGLKDSVSIRGEMGMDQIIQEAAEASFYLQCSTYEGMAMSVVEAMQLGLVPVVTPVGEIRNYCRDGEHGILIRSDEDAVEEVLRLMDDPARYRSLQSNAVAVWQGKITYRDSMLQACREILDVGAGAAP